MDEPVWVCMTAPLPVPHRCGTSHVPPPSTQRRTSTRASCTLCSAESASWASLKVCVHVGVCACGCVFLCACVCARIFVHVCVLRRSWVRMFPRCDGPSAWHRTTSLQQHDVGLLRDDDAVWCGHMHPPLAPPLPPVLNPPQDAGSELLWLLSHSFGMERCVVVAGATALPFAGLHTSVQPPMQCMPCE